MPHPFPPRLREKHIQQASVICLVLAVLSWPAFLFIMADMPWVLIPLGILFLLIFIPFFVKKKILLVFLAANPLTLMLIYYIQMPTVRYFSGEPTLIDCGYSEYAFDKSEMLYINYYDDDCELGGVFYLLSDDLNNVVTRFWVNFLGNPIDEIPPELMQSGLVGGE